MQHRPHFHNGGFEIASRERETPLEIRRLQQNTRSFQLGVQQVYLKAHLPEQNSLGCAPVQPSDSMNDRSNPAAGPAEGSREQLYIYSKNQYHFLLRWKVSSCESLSFIHIHATVEGVRWHPRRTPGSENEIRQSKSAALWLRQEGLFWRFSCFAACTPTLLVPHKLC